MLQRETIKHMNTVITYPKDKKLSQYYFTNIVIIFINYAINKENKKTVIVWLNIFTYEKNENYVDKIFVS